MADEKLPEGWHWHGSVRDVHMAQSPSGMTFAYVGPGNDGRTYFVIENGKDYGEVPCDVVAAIMRRAGWTVEPPKGGET